MVFVDPPHAASVFAAPAAVDAGPAGVQLVEYFAKACPHCVHLQPVWAAAKSQGVEGVDFVSKECYDGQWMPGKDIASCKAHGIDAFPTMVLYKKDGSELTVPPLMSGTVKARTEELLDFVKSQVGRANEDVKQAGLDANAAGLSFLVPNPSTRCGNRDFVNFL